MSLVRVDLLFMSVYGGMLILVVLFFRVLLKAKLPKRIFSILWCVALLRLLLPFSVDVPFSVFSVFQNQMAVLLDHSPADREDRSWYSMTDFGYYENADGSSNGGSVAGIHGSSEDSRPGGEAIAGDGMKKGRFSVGPVSLFLLRKAGLAGTIICAAVFLALYLNCLGRFRAALPVADPAVKRWLGRNRLLRKVRVCRSDRISSPLTYGIIRPVILLPKLLGQEGQGLEYILQHEMIHIRRFDGVWKLAMAAVLCLHWFNPLVWVMYVFMNRDLELSCDEAVLRIFGAKARKGYALTLIGMEESRHLPVPLYSGFGRNAVEERVGEIMKYKKKTKVAVGVGAAMILAVACMFATTTRAGEDSPEADKDSTADVYEYLIMDPPPAQTFSPARPDLTENAPAGEESHTYGGEAEDREAEASVAKWLLQRLISAAEDHDSISGDLAEGYEVDLDILDAIREWKEGEIHVRFHPTDDYCTASIGVITTESGEDSRDYLTVELLKEGEDWKICFMGIEK